MGTASEKRRKRKYFETFHTFVDEDGWWPELIKKTAKNLSTLCRVQNAWTDNWSGRTRKPDYPTIPENSMRMPSREVRTRVS
jgi:hypothetical protein